MSGSDVLLLVGVVAVALFVVVALVRRGRNRRALFEPIGLQGGGPPRREVRSPSAPPPPAPPAPRAGDALLAPASRRPQIDAGPCWVTGRDRASCDCPDCKERRRAR
ncbi:MAG TPA: hypothetical protein VOB72_26285 [Candidatus Dormibacteraeota bacterium]|nr:hypothetical protein [Candidatus Dormibacteraeota bacterium]